MQQQELAGLRALNEGRFEARVEGETEGALLVNQIAQRLQALSSEMSLLRADLADQGRFGSQIEVPDSQGDWATLVDDVNAISANLTTQFRGLAWVITAIANGDFCRKADVGGSGEIKELEDTLNVMAIQFSTLACEITRVVRAVGAGQPGTEIEVRGLAGTWKDLAVNVDTMAVNR